MHPKADYGVLNDLARQRINIPRIERNWDDLPQVAGSLKMGAVSASELIRGLQGGGRPSTLGRAIGELGRVAKTLYVLNYLDDEAYRRRILIQLNRGESRHGVARAIFHGQRGELRQRYPMFGVARRNPLRCKGRIFDSSLHHGFFPLGWRGRALVDELQRLQDQPRVGTAAGHPTTFRLSLQAEGHQPNRRQRVHRPRRRQINTRLFESSAEKSLDQQGQRRDKNVRL